MLLIMFNFIYKYFFAIIITYVVGMFSKSLIKQFGNDRAQKIKETILVAMLFAEQQFGIGNGDQKWEVAYQKIIELLQAQGITLKTEEIPVVETLMKANVPKINAVVYSALPKEALLDRKISIRTPEATAMVDELKKKYPDQSPVAH